MRIHYLQHVPFENPGSILTWAEKNGHCVTNTQLYQSDFFPPQKDFDWLVVMGGPMNVYEEAEYPWLVREKAFIKASIDSGKTVIGLCLGGQLIADVAGGRVTRGHFKEIGWHTVRLTKAALDSPLFAFLPPEPVVFQWHGDTFSKLPDDAVLLAESDACAHQAFVYRKKVFGFQFHLENTPEIIKGLVDNCSDELVPGRYVQPAQELIGHPEHIARDNAWMDMFLTKLSERGGL